MQIHIDWNANCGHCWKNGESVMSNTNLDAATVSMKALRDEIEQRLLGNPDYRALVALDRAIGELSSSPVRDASRARGDERFKNTHASSQRSLTQPEAAARLLEEFGPLPTHTILSRIGSLGVTVSGNDPLVNLSSSISKSGQFKSIRINGTSHWWFKDRELPQTRTIPDEEAFIEPSVSGSSKEESVVNL